MLTERYLSVVEDYHRTVCAVAAVSLSQPGLKKGVYDTDANFPDREKPIASWKVSRMTS